MMDRIDELNELNELCASPWADIPQTLIPENWRETEPSPELIAAQSPEAREIRVLEQAERARRYERPQRKRPSFEERCAEMRARNRKGVQLEFRNREEKTAW